MSRVFLVFLTPFFLYACSTQQPIHNVSGSLVPLMTDGSMLTMDEVNWAIVSAAKIKQWKPKSLDEDTIEASITVRERHKATVDINYSQRSYDIVLKNSEGLDQKSGMIHRNYNKWIILLDEMIQAELLEEATK
jgi:uncharacterized protein YcfL